MKFLMLRGRVPIDRDPKQIMFNNLEDCDDMWTQLAYRLTDSYGEVWYWGGSRKVRYANNFVERWVNDFSITKHDFDPDIIFARGGFQEYDVVLSRFPKAYKIYYGAGKRFMPQSSFENYDLVLNDTQKQIDKSSKYFNSRLFIKPAADNIFKPVEKRIKYDVILVGNCRSDDLKGIKFALNTLPNTLKILHCGISDNNFRKQYPHVDFTGWIPRKDLPSKYAMAKVAVICCKNVDSCPRVIPEALACDTPIIVLDRVNLWNDMYINFMTGRSCSTNDLVSTVMNMYNNYQTYAPRDYYDYKLSLDHAANFIKELMNADRI